MTRPSRLQSGRGVDRTLSRRRFLTTAAGVTSSATSIPTSVAATPETERGRPPASDPTDQGTVISRPARTYSLPGPGPESVDVMNTEDLAALNQLTAGDHRGLAAHSVATQRRLIAKLDYREQRSVHRIVDVQADLDLDEHRASDLGVDETHGLRPTESVYELTQDDGIRLADNTTVELPPGTYVIPDTISGSVRNWTLRGTGETPTDVRLVTRGSNKRLLDITGGRNVRVENLTIHNGDDGEHAVGFRFRVDDGLLVRSLHHTGLSPREGNTGDHEQFNRQEYSLQVAVLDPDGVAITDGFRKTSPTEVSGHAENDPAFGAYGSHRGLWYIRNSVSMHGGGDGCSYTSRTRGGVRFENCALKNNYASTIRLGGGESWVRNCTIVCDAREARQINDLLFPGVAPMNPIVWESGGAYSGTHSRRGGLVENTRIEMRYPPQGRMTQACLAVDGSHGGVIVRDCEILNNSPKPSILADPPGSSFMNDHRVPRDPHGMYLENVRFTGEGTGAAIDINDRRATGTGLCVQMPNGGMISGIERTGTGCRSGGDVNRPPLYQELLALQNGVPSASSGIGATGVSRAGSAIGSVVAAVSAVLVLLVGCVAVGPALLLKMLID